VTHSGSCGLQSNRFFHQHSMGKVAQCPLTNLISVYNVNSIAVRGHLSISYLTSSTLSYLLIPSQLLLHSVHMYTSSPRVDDLLSPIVDDHRTLKSSTLNFHLCSHLSHLGQASYTLGHVHKIPQHPLHHVDLG
jgi:hypothetical protein